RNDSSVTTSPWRVREGISSPLRKRPTERSSPSPQSRRVIFRPSARNHQLSGSPDASGESPPRNCVRLKTGWAERKWISRRVNSSSCSFRSSSSHEYHESSLSWQYALLFPCCVRASSSPPSSIGTPCESSSVVRKL